MFVNFNETENKTENKEKKTSSTRETESAAALRGRARSHTNTGGSQLPGALTPEEPVQFAGLFGHPQTCSMHSHKHTCIHMRRRKRRRTTTNTGGWRDISASKKTFYSRRRLGFGSQHPHGDSAGNCSAKGSNPLFWSPWTPGMHLMDIETCRQNLHTYNKINTCQQLIFHAWNRSSRGDRAGGL